MENKRTSLTEGTIWKNIIMFALPIFLGNVFQQLYNTMDSLIVGKFIDSDALADIMEKLQEVKKSLSNLKK